MLVMHGHPQAIPAFLTIAVMPMTYSIAYGVIAGLVSYIVINATNWLIDALRAGLKALPGFIKHTMMHKVLPPPPPLVTGPGTSPMGWHHCSGTPGSKFPSVCELYACRHVPFESQTLHWTAPQSAIALMSPPEDDFHTSYVACVENLTTLSDMKQQECHLK